MNTFGHLAVEGERQRKRHRLRHEVFDELRDGDMRDHLQTAQTFAVRPHGAIAHKEHSEFAIERAPRALSTQVLRWFESSLIYS